MIRECLLILMPGIVSMSVWRRMHKGSTFGRLDYLEGTVVFDLAIYLLNILLIWARKWEAFDVASFGCSGTFKYTLSSIVFAVGLPALVTKLAKALCPKGK